MLLGCSAGPVQPVATPVATSTPDLKPTATLVPATATPDLPAAPAATIVPAPPTAMPTATTAPLPTTTPPPPALVAVVPATATAPPRPPASPAQAPAHPTMPPTATATLVPTESSIAAVTATTTATLTVSTPAAVTASPMATLYPPATPSPVPPLSGRIDVALDPGHSVADPGAGGGGLIEHELTLRLARKIRERLAVRGLAALLTRTDDQPLTTYRHSDPTTRIRLEQEARIAAGAGARLFVSIHFDANNDPRIGGTTVYFNAENHGAASRQLGTAIAREIVTRVRSATGYDLPDLGVREDLSAGKPYGHFFSLRGPFPSVLVEGMFLSNPSEAALLAQETTLDVLADAYAEGIARYLAEAPV